MIAYYNEIDPFAAAWLRELVAQGQIADGVGAVTIYRKPEQGRVAEGIVCPAMTGATTCCGACGLCWAEAAKRECIVFVAHGKKRRGASKVREAA
mgnify:FL=1